MSRTTSMGLWRFNRVSGIDANPSAFTSRAALFAASVPTLGSATLLVVKDQDGSVRGYLLAPDSAEADRAAMHLAQAVGAERVRHEGELPDLGVSSVARMHMVADAAVARESLHGVDPGEAARALAMALSPGDWVAVTVRAAAGRERKRHGKWLSHRLGHGATSHHSVSQSPLVMSVMVGADGSRAARSLVDQVASVLPGFDLQVSARVVSPRAWVAGSAGVAGLLWGAGVAATWWDPAVELAGAWAHFGGWAGALVALVCLGWATGVLPGPGGGVLAAAARGRFDAAPAAGPVWVSPTRTVVRDNERVEMAGSYPLHPRAFLVGPHVVAGVVAPQAGAASGGTQTASRDTPVELTRPIGPYLGVSADGRGVYLSAADLLYGVGVLGRPGAGKSALVRSMMAWAMVERTRPSGRPGFPGAANTLVAFESKGDGVASYMDWAGATGDHVVAVEVGDDASPKVDLFDIPGTPGQRAEFFVNAMVYAFADGSIQDRSFDTLRRVFTAAIAVQGRAIAGVNPTLNPMQLAHVLLGGDGDGAGAEVAGAIRSESVRLEGAGTPDADLAEATRALATLYEGRSESSRRAFTEAPQNKVSQLLAAGSWWGADRPAKSWAQILTDHDSVVVNTGITTSGAIVEDRLTALMSGLLMFSLRAAIMRTCSGWGAQGRSVSIFADELSLLAGSSAEVVTWMRNQGRSYGVRPMLATQYPEQLEPAVRTALMSFSTVATFTQDSASVATEVAADASADGSEWTRADVVNLPRFQVILRTNVDQVRVSPCTVAVADFESDRAGFAALQSGTAPAAAGGVA